MFILPSFGLDVLILYSKLSATKCVMFPSSTRMEPWGNEARKNNVVNILFRKIDKNNGYLQQWK